MSDKNKCIGGFFELEIEDKKTNTHPNSIALSTGRGCINLIIQKVSPTKIYLPFYTCNALFAPIIEKGIKYEFYAINKELEPVNIPKLKKSELLIYINFFGVKKNFSEQLSRKYKSQVIIDNTHQFFHYGYRDSYSFTSARKHFGVPDGAYLYGISNQKKTIAQNNDVSILHNVERLIGKQEESYQYYLDYEASLNNEVKEISLISKQLLGNIDYSLIEKQRLENFTHLHKTLSELNEIKLDYKQISSPFCYPLLLSKNIDKKHFYKHKIFIPTLWDDVLQRKINGFKYECLLSNNGLFLPIDHRYDKQDMQRIINFILDTLYGK